MLDINFDKLINYDEAQAYKAAGIELIHHSSLPGYKIVTPSQKHTTSLYLELNESEVFKTAMQKLDEKFQLPIVHAEKVGNSYSIPKCTVANVVKVKGTTTILGSTIVQVEQKESNPRVVTVEFNLEEQMRLNSFLSDESGNMFVDYFNQYYAAITDALKEDMNYNPAKTLFGNYFLTTETPWFRSERMLIKHNEDGTSSLILRFYSDCIQL